MDNWFDEMEGITGDESMVTIAKEYDSKDAALIGGLNAKKAVGKPFKLPESLEKLPDDKVRADFTAKVGKLLGKDISGVKDAEELGDVNFADGLSDARMLNEDLVKEVKEWAVKTNAPKSQVKEVAQMINKFIMGFVNTEAKTKAEKSTEVTNALNGLYGGDDGVKIQQENVHRMFLNHAGLTVEEYDDVAKTIVNSGMSQNVAISKALFNLSKPFVEAKTEKGQQATQEKTTSLKERQDKELPETTKAIWGK